MYDKHDLKLVIHGECDLKSIGYEELGESLGKREVTRHA